MQIWATQKELSTTHFLLVWEELHVEENRELMLGFLTEHQPRGIFPKLLSNREQNGNNLENPLTPAPKYLFSTW